MPMPSLGSCTPHSVIALMLTAVLVGCAPTQVQELPRIVEPKRLAVTQSFYDHSVEFLSGSAEPAAGEIQRLIRFLAAAGAERGDRLVISPSAGTDAGLAARRLARLETLVATARPGAPQPLGPSALARPGPSGPTEPVKVVLIRHTVQVPRCPDWSIGSIGGADNTMSSNFGCANAVNLGLMIADPRDLVRGRDAGVFDGERAAKAVERYRSGETGQSEPSQIFLEPGSMNTAGEQQ